jgi:glycosyltransferase involved in cell wall biosynthesis
MAMREGPQVSIILPTYNRADVIGRAVRSVLEQTLADWELLVVDDGSTDETLDVVSGVDARIRVLRQENGGAYVARNTGLASAGGRLVTFLDSDDVWLPHFLELTTGFLRQSPEDQFVTTEYFEDWGDGVPIRFEAYGIGKQYPALARAVGSRMLDLPAGETDDYLRVYSSREPLGDWGRAIACRAGVADPQLYRGHIFEHMRWGYLNWLPVTVLTRRAVETVGPFTTHTRSAGDYRFLCLLARMFRANMIGVPSAIKYARGIGARALKQDHLATGVGAYRFEVNKLGFFDELFWQPRRGDTEIDLLRCYYSFNAGRAALRLGRRIDAIDHLRAAAQLKPKLWRAYLGLAVARFPSDRVVRSTYRLAQRATDICERLIKGELTFGSIWRRLVRGPRGER